MNSETRFHRRFGQAHDAEVIGVGEECRLARVRLQAYELDIGGARVGEVGEALLVHESADATTGGVISELHWGKARHENVAAYHLSVSSARAHLVIAIAVEPEPDLRETLKVIAEDTRRGESHGDPIAGQVEWQKICGDREGASRCESDKRRGASARRDGAVATKSVFGWFVRIDG